MSTPKTAQLHRFYEDILALLCAGVLVSLGILIFNTQGVLAGGSAGIALIGAQLLPVSFGMLFFAVNLPFYILSWRQLGKRFTINTFVSVSFISVLSEQLQRVIHINDVHPLIAATVGGTLIGVGLLIMFRHHSSLGGLGILAFYLQNRFNIRAGKFQMAADCTILMSSGLLFGAQIMLLSVISAITLNLLLAVNHKPGRYQGTSTRPRTHPKPEPVHDDSECPSH
ncbi:YitT family protein [Aestuariibacter halophilus]|uniref:YitT family protein n=1 Tax=Fluctibacter halophilus TaxID=226011 RepID=A0ABS8GBU0_9ALTE|nr:YitT family protein [Aestuariibacter halophilus]MCC2618012.1 YitT family protein [Aestuariibacter halophilus]